MNISSENKCIYVIFTTKTKLLNPIVLHNFTNLFIYKLIEHLTYILQNNNIYYYYYSYFILPTYFS